MNCIFKFPHWLLGLSLVACLLLVTACQRQPQNQLEEIKARGYIKVYTRIAPTTMYIGDQDFTGFEYELVKLFADYLEVDVQIITENDLAKMMSELEKGHADLIAAGLTVTKERVKKLRFSPSYQEISSKLVYKQGQKRPRDFSQIEGGLMVLANSSHSATLRKEQENYPELTWSETNEFSASELLDKVLDETIRYTVADSNDLELARQVEPELAVAFSISGKQNLAWALAKNSDDSLFAKVIEFFNQARTDGSIDYLIERYYGHLTKFDYVGSREFIRAIDSRLEAFIPDFIQAASDDLDWRFLAAMGYQESHWKPDARSPTGVRGLMMLTQNTAKQLGIKDRLDPKQSIIGGADYFRLMLQKIPERITDPDRNWFALAGYNVGFGHLEDARRLAQADGQVPDTWQVIKDYLPLLRQKKWYSKTRFGYARGNEPVRYVGNIRQYYAVLQQLFNLDGSRKQLEQEPVELELEETLAPELEQTENQAESQIDQ
ncbi:membrane-bound lytic murein transglycosylase MltF [Kangiella sp. TOML190]|uniref:membrane-bound lytic murein transglycosylase MltF n=1 Tax=Kangiella sp. TOML190 TaxID=2931351 RepID=UPI00203BE466|nr:membrane-bound lytic murein transglycosylase MltF [Kangiella sp. TOML190]